MEIIGNYDMTAGRCSEALRDRHICMDFQRIDGFVGS